MTLKELTEAIKKHDAPFRRIYMCSEDYRTFCLDWEWHEFGVELAKKVPGTEGFAPHYSAISIHVDSVLQLGQVRFE